MKQNPCSSCALGAEYKGRHFPSHKVECTECESLKKHKEYLKEHRKYVEGEPIASLEQLLQWEWVM